MFKKIMFLLLFVFIVGCAYGKHMNKGDTLFAEGQYEQALKEYEEAQKIDPESQEAAGKILATKEKLVSSYTHIARTHLDAGEYFKAIDATSSAYQKLPGNSIVLKLIEDLRSKVFEKSDAYVANGDYATGLALVEELVAKLPPIQEKAAIKVSTLKKAWVKDLVKKGEKAKVANRKGEALLFYAKAAQLTGDPNLIAIRETWKGELKNTNAYNIVLNVSGSGSKEVQSMVLNKKEDLTTLKIYPKTSKPKLVEGTLNIKLGKKKFEVEKSAITKTKHYKSGTKQVENPFYKTKQNKVIDEEKRLVQAEKDLTKANSDVQRYQDAVAKEGPSPNTSTSAEQNLQHAKSEMSSRQRKLNSQRDALMKAKEELAKTPQTKEEDVFSDHKYQVTTHTLKGSLQSSGMIKFTTENLSVGYKAKTSVSDTTHQAHGPSKLGADPLTLPTKTSLYGALYRDTAGYVEGAIRQAFQKWRAKKLAQAKEATVEEDRINEYMMYIISDPRNVAPEVLSEIESSRGIANSNELLLATQNTQPSKK